MLKRFDIADGAIVSSDRDECAIRVYVNPDAAERSVLVGASNIDEHTLTSALDPDELSRVEFEADHLAIIWKRPKNYSSQDQFLFKVSSIGIFMYKTRMIVVMTEDVPVFEGRQFQKVPSLLDVMLKLLYRTIYHYLEHLKVINAISGEIEQKVNASMENRYLIHMFTLEKSLVYYLNAINSNAMVIEKLKNSAVKIGFTPENIEFLDDIVIENSQCYRQAEIHSNILTGLMDARGSIVNNNLNILIKRLTVINVVFMPLNLLAGIGGMSEYSMMTKSVWWPISYSAFLAGMVVIGFFTFLIMNRIGGERGARFWPRRKRT